MGANEAQRGMEGTAEGLGVIVLRYSQPLRSARRAASARLRVPSFLIAVER